MVIVESSGLDSMPLSLVGAGLELDRCEHAKRGVARWRLWKISRYSKIALASSTRVRQRFAVEELDLHSAPERLDDSVVVAVTDRSHRRQQARVDGAAGERPGGELACPDPSGSRSRSGWRWSIAMPSALRHQRRGLARGIDRPADDPAGEDVEHDRAIDLALACRVLGDVGDPEPFGIVKTEVPLDEIVRGRDVRHPPEPRTTLTPWMPAQCTSISTAL